VHPAVISQRVEVVANHDRGQVFCDGKTVADHEWVCAWHQTITDPEHREASVIVIQRRCSTAIWSSCSRTGHSAPIRWWRTMLAAQAHVLFAFLAFSIVAGGPLHARPRPALRYGHKARAVAASLTTARPDLALRVPTPA
jgi:hypothetical protein